MKKQSKPITGKHFRQVFRSFVGLYASESEAARALKLKPAAIQGWKLRETIPAKHVKRVRQLIFHRADLLSNRVIPFIQKNPIKKYINNEH